MYETKYTQNFQEKIKIIWINFWFVFLMDGKGELMQKVPTFH